MPERSDGVWNPKWLPLWCRGISSSTLLLAGLCFCMPWVNGCERMTGWETVRVSAQTPVFFPHSSFSWFLAVGLVSCLWFFKKRRPITMITAALCAAGSLIYPVVLYALPPSGIDRSFSVPRWIEHVWNTETRVFLPPYWIAVTALIVAALYGLLEDRARGNEGRFPWVGFGLYFVWAVAMWALGITGKLFPGPAGEQGPHGLVMVLCYALTGSSHLVAGFFIVRTLVLGDPENRPRSHVTRP